MIKQNSNKKLPDSWKFVRFGDVIDIQGGSQPPKKHFVYEPQEGYVRLLQIRDFGNKPVPTYVPKYKVTKFCTKDDIFIARYGASLGRIVTGLEGAYNVALAKVIFKEETFFSKYLFYLLQTPYFQTPIHMISRSAQNGFNKGEIFPIEIPIAPFHEQKYIVEEIEKQFSRLDEAVDNLTRIKANLKRYKASVLKAAVEGKLTEEWRKANPDVESANKFLKRILVERRKKWEEAELAKMKAKGKEPKDDKWKKKYKEPGKLATEKILDTPSTWLWVRLDAVTEIKGGITKDSKRKIENAKELPYLRVANVQRGYLNLDKMKYIKVSEVKLPELLLENGDILFNEGGDRDKLGRGWIWEGQINKCIYQNHVFRARLYLKEMNGKLFSWFGNTFGQQYFMAKGKQTTNLASINKTMLSAFPVPLPPLEEQMQLIKEIEKRMTVVSAIEQEIIKNSVCADRLRQSILKKAFTGKLVPQINNDKSPVIPQKQST